MEYLSSIFSGGFMLPYELGEQYEVAWGKWEHFAATRLDDKRPASLFRLTVPKVESLVLEAARNGVKRLRMTKHPRILTFEWSGEVESGGNVTIYVASEPAQPLPAALKMLDLSGQQRDMYLAMGVRQAAQAVAFLTNQCKAIHGNVCVKTVLVTPSLDWRLGFLDMLSEHAHLASSLLARCGKFVADCYKPPELERSDMEALTQGPPWAVDAWGLGCLMQEVFSGKALVAPEQLRDVAAVPKEVLAEYQKLLGQNPARRLNPNKLSESDFLKNDLVDVVHFLENLSLREPLEKTKFFRNLPKQLQAFPPQICTKKLLPLISAALEFGGAPAIALGCLLQVGRMLDDEAAFKARVIPIISALFASPDHAIRNTLVSNIHEYAPFLGEAVVEASIFPQLARGLSEPNGYLREQSLKAMLPIAPKLSARTLNGPLLKYLAKLQVDPEPSIRANTTVLLGNIAAHLGAATARRILVNAFTRALRDVFPPSRVAALKALMATAGYYPATEVAARVVPAVAPLMLDSQADVRQAALKAAEFFMRVLRQAAEDIDRGVDPTKATNAVSNSKEAQDLASNVSSFLGWAISTISSAALPAGAPRAGSPRATPQKASPFRASGGSALALSTPGSGAAARANGDADAGGAVAARRDLNAEGWGEGDAAFAAQPAALSGTGRLAGNVDMSSLDTMAAGGWGDAEGWGDEEDAAPAAPSKPKPKPKLSKKSGAKGD